MKYRKKILLMLLLFTLPIYAQQAKPNIATMPMLRVLQSTDFEMLAPYMNSKLEIALPNENANIFSLNQAKAVLSNYFKTNKVIFAGFRTKNIQKHSQTLTYIFKTSTQTFTIFVVVKNDKIIKFKIDDGNVW